MIYDGKTYRNLQDQVGYLTGKYDDLQDQINDVRSHLTHYVVVDTLPTGDDIDPSAVYLLGPMGTAPDQYYEEWVYVQKADESWMWEKLGDTDSVDLSGYLEKQTGSTTYAKVYAKNADGTQGMLDVVNDAVPSSILLRDANGRTKVAAPNGGGDAVNLTYANNNYLAKQTGSTTYRKTYTKLEDGTQDMLDTTGDAVQYSLVVRTTNGQINLPDQSQYNPSTDQSISKRYADGQYLAKQTGASTYPQAYVKAADGTQTMMSYASGLLSWGLVQRSGLQIVVPETPDANNNAASKAYVDAAVGQLLYLHEIDLRYTISASIRLGIKCYLVNGDSTAITSLTRAIFKRITASYGALNPDANETVACAITKMPDNFRQDEFDEPYASFLYQYYSGGSLTSGNTFGITPTVTDVVVSF